MGEFCTCGAKLPEDARFCHKCGKPQFDEPLVEAGEVEALPVAAPPVPPEIGFHNLTAVRGSLLAWLPGAGFLDYWLLPAEGHLTRWLFGAILRRIAGLPLPAG